MTVTSEELKSLRGKRYICSIENEFIKYSDENGKTLFTHERAWELLKQEKMT